MYTMPSPIYHYEHNSRNELSVTTQNELDIDCLSLSLVEDHTTPSESNSNCSLSRLTQKNEEPNTHLTSSISTLMDNSISSQKYSFQKSPTSTKIENSLSTKIDSPMISSQTPTDYTSSDYESDSNSDASTSCLTIIDCTPNIHTEQNEKFMVHNKPNVDPKSNDEFMFHNTPIIDLEQKDNFGFDREVPISARLHSIDRMSKIDSHFSDSSTTTVSSECHFSPFFQCQDAPLLKSMSVQNTRAISPFNLQKTVSSPKLFYHHCKCKQYCRCGFDSNLQSCLCDSDLKDSLLMRIIIIIQTIISYACRIIIAVFYTVCFASKSICSYFVLFVNIVQFQSDYREMQTKLLTLSKIINMFNDEDMIHDQKLLLKQSKILIQQINLEFERTK